MFARFGAKAHKFVMTPAAQDRRYTVLQGSVRSGKTWAVNAKLIVQLSRYEVGGKRLICGASKQTVYRNMLLDLFEVAGKGNYSYNSTTGELWLFDKQYFVIGGRDEAAFKNILGMTVGVAVCDEAVEYPRSFFAQLLMRMSPKGARLYATTNPGNPYVHFKTDFLDAQEIQPDLTNLHFMLSDNPNIDEVTKTAIRASQVGMFYRRYILGEWCIAEGSIWRDSWDDKENTYTNATRPITLLNKGGYVDHWFSVDVGTDHPQVYCEFYDTGTVIRLERTWRWDSRKQLKQMTNGQYADELETFMDANGGRGCEVRLPPEAAAFRAELVHRGMWVVDACNDVEPGIHTVSTLLAQRNLLINIDQCNGMEKFIPNYAWDEKAAKRGVEQPLKQNDDDVDAMRYGLHGKIPQWRLTSANA